MFDPVVDDDGIWICGPHSAYRVQGLEGRPWAIWVDRNGTKSRAFSVGVDSSAYSGGCLLEKGQLDLFFGTEVAGLPGQPWQPDPPLEALHIRTLDPVAGVVHEGRFAQKSGDQTSKLKFPFRDAGNVYASSYSPRDGYALRLVVDQSWTPVWTPPVLQPPAGWEPGAFSPLKPACPPTLSPDGSWVMSFVTEYRSSTGATSRNVAAICSVRGQNTVWSIVLGGNAHVQSISTDVDYAGEVYVALVLRTDPGPGQVVTYKLGPDGSPQPGWPRRLSTTEDLSEAKVRVSTRDVFVGGIIGTSFAALRPFVASYKRDGTPSTLFGREFRANNREEWRVCGLSVLNEDFFLTGYTITPDASDPATPEHALVLSKFDRYGVLI